VAGALSVADARSALEALSLVDEPENALAATIRV
jgi:hypothetical protein